MAGQVLLIIVVVVSFASAESQKNGESEVIFGTPRIASEKREIHLERDIIRVPGKQKSKEVVIDNAIGLQKEYKYTSEDMKKFRSWIEQCVEYSKDGKFCLVVDKASHEMNVYENGEKIETYPVELGLNPYDDKKMLGDNSTPEGIYKIRRVVKASVFYKALYVDYPNAQDKREFRQWKMKGMVPQKARIGGNIEIHGSGADKEDWTLGCIALSNSNIDDLYGVLGLENYKKMSWRELKKITEVIKVCIVRYGVRENYYRQGRH